MDYNVSAYNQDYLKHYGVKGMKWGVRKVRDRGRRVLEKQSIRSRAASNYFYSEGHNKLGAIYDYRSLSKQDKSFRDGKAFSAGLYDMGVKTVATASLIALGAKYVNENL